jgi:hypothetical protein
LVLLIILIAGRTVAVAAQHDGVPSVVMRRLTQAIWPDLLFDSTGKPEQPFKRLRWPMGYPDYNHLQVSTHPVKSARFLADTMYAALVPSETNHGAPTRRAVWRRASDAITLLEPSDIGLVLDRASPALTVADSLELRQTALDLLAASCLLACDVSFPVQRRVGAGDRLPDRAGAPTPRSHLFQGRLTMTFPVMAEGIVFGIVLQEFRSQWIVHVVAPESLSQF